MAIPKLALIPSGYKAGKLYSVLPTNGDGDFTTTRNTVATRVNENGLIEEVGVNVPRLDYSDGGCPSLLLENSSTNLITQSEDFSNAYWSKSGASVVGNNSISPNGALNADKLVESSANSQHYLQRNFYSTNGLSYTYKIYVKMNGRRNIALRENGSTGYYVSFDLLNGIILEQSNATGKIKKLKDGWFEITHTSVAGDSFNIAYYLLSDSYTSGNPQTSPYQGDGTSGVYIYGAQFEQNSYATSYIKTVGTAQTRSADTANGAGNASTFNDSEGVLMAEISALVNSDTSRYITLSDGTTSNRIIFDFRPTQNVLRVVLVVTTSQYSYDITLNDIISNNKVAFKYKENDIALWVNGIEVNTSLSANVPTANTFDRLNFGNSSGAVPFYGSAKQIQYFDSALNDSDLEKLTSWTSFTAMANGQSYTII